MHCWSLPVISYRVRIAFAFTQYHHYYMLVLTRASPRPCPLSCSEDFLSSGESITAFSVRFSVRSVTAEPPCIWTKGKGLDPLLLLSCQLCLNPQLIMKCRTWEWMQKIWNRKICFSFRLFLLLLLLNPSYFLLHYRKLVVWKTAWNISSLYLETFLQHYFWSKLPVLSTFRIMRLEIHAYVTEEVLRTAGSSSN